MSYTLASDADSKVTTAYTVTGYPTLVVIDQAGVVRKVEVGVGEPSELDATVRRLLDH